VVRLLLPYTHLSSVRLASCAQFAKAGAVVAAPYKNKITASSRVRIFRRNNHSKKVSQPERNYRQIQRKADVDVYGGINNRSG